LLAALVAPARLEGEAVDPVVSSIDDWRPVVRWLASRPGRVALCDRKLPRWRGREGIVARADGTVLLLLGHRSRRPIRHLDLPGGKMEYGERLVDTLARETRRVWLEVTPGLLST